MKNILFIFILFISQSVIAQNFVDLTVSGGSSTIIKKRTDPTIFDQDNGKRTPIPMFLIDLTKSKHSRIVDLTYGLRLASGVGTHHPAYGYWFGIFFGGKIGVTKSYKRFNVGFNINPTIRLYGQPTLQGYGRALNGELTPVYNVEINPNIGIPIWNNKIDLVFDYSIGLTPLYELWSNRYYAHYLAIGLKFKI